MQYEGTDGWFGTEKAAERWKAAAFQREFELASGQEQRTATWG